ncbi:hypothetical protein MMC14_007106 [Varicellaria rhodocarpa]|nr:hypothetical protein [Varicellaria rhodocarpa]
MTKEAAKQSVVETTRQSPPLEFPGTVDETWVKGKTILITGGASGFGEGFVRRWAAAGATVILGDVNVTKGMKLQDEVREETGNSDVHFLECNVTNWISQVKFFKEAVRLSPHGGIDTVVANAGKSDHSLKIEKPENLDLEDPPPPDLSVLDVNLNGVLYTIHLALFYLPRNPGSAPASPRNDLNQTHRDRHILLLASVAGFISIPNQLLYGASKHGVVGLYRCLCGSAFVHGVRVNLIAPYFIDTPFLTAPARAMLAGGTIGVVEDVIEAGTRFVADPRIVGRAVTVGPRLNVEQDEDGKWSLSEGSRGEEKAIWEIYPHDMEDSDIWQRRMIAIMNRAIEIRGWTGWAADIVGAITYGLKGWWRG